VSKCCFIPPPTNLPVIDPGMLMPGDALLTSNQRWWVSAKIQTIQDSPWSHAAMVVDGPAGQGLRVAEMTWPKVRILPLAKWLKTEGPAWACRLFKPLDQSKRRIVTEWWEEKVGAWYDLFLLLSLAPATLWQRFSTWARLPASWRHVQPWAGNGVCSVCVAQAWLMAGLSPDEDTGMTPADIPRQLFLGGIERIGS
jgi:hypothetical protein